MSITRARLAWSLATRFIRAKTTNMAGVQANCRECGFMIFDEQTRSMLCDECLALPPSERISGVRERRAREEESRQRWIAENPPIDWMARIRSGMYIAPRRDPMGELREQNAQLLEEVKELRRQLAASEIKEENVPEVTSFLRKFDNLDVEGAEEV
jgi:hypothetical protein